jgi:hypothetical protein
VRHQRVLASGGAKLASAIEGMNDVSLAGGGFRLSFDKACRRHRRLSRAWVARSRRPGSMRPRRRPSAPLPPALDGSA